MGLLRPEALTLITLLLFAAATDLREQRVPNLLVLTVLLCGSVFTIGHHGLDGLPQVGAGVAVGLFLFLPFYLRGAMGAGDVKLMAATGAFTGFHALWAVGLTLVAGTVVALVYMAGMRLAGPGFGGARTGRRFPYVIAIAVGASAAMLTMGVQ